MIDTLDLSLSHTPVTARINSCQFAVRLDQMCATESTGEVLVDCKDNWNGWVEVCACKQDFCNTFNYLRTQMERVRSSQKRGQYAGNTGRMDGGQYGEHRTRTHSL